MDYLELLQVGREALDPRFPERGLLSHCLLVFIAPSQPVHRVSQTLNRVDLNIAQRLSRSQQRSSIAAALMQHTGGGGPVASSQLEVHAVGKPME